MYLISKMLVASAGHIAQFQEERKPSTVLCAPHLKSAFFQERLVRRFSTRTQARSLQSRVWERPSGSKEQGWTISQELVSIWFDLSCIGLKSPVLKPLRLLAYILWEQCQQWRRGGPHGGGASGRGPTVERTLPRRMSQDMLTSYTDNPWQNVLLI